MYVQTVQMGAGVAGPRDRPFFRCFKCDYRVRRQRVDESFDGLLPRVRVLPWVARDLLDREVGRVLRELGEGARAELVELRRRLAEIAEIRRRLIDKIALVDDTALSQEYEGRINELHTEEAALNARVSLLDATDSQAQQRAVVGFLRSPFPTRYVSEGDT